MFLSYLKRFWLCVLGHYLVGGPITCHWDRAFWDWAICFASEFPDNFEILWCPAQILGSPARLCAAAPKYNRASSMFHSKYYVLSFKDSFFLSVNIELMWASKRISFCPSFQRTFSQKHCGLPIWILAKFSLASSCFSLNSGVLLCLLPLSPLSLTRMDGVIRHRCTLTLKFSLYFCGSFSWLFVYPSSYFSVQFEVDFPLVVTSREVGLHSPFTSLSWSFHIVTLAQLGPM